MKEIRLISLSLEKFKGCSAQTWEFGGKNAAIYGANGTGKSTIYNALTWLLFDKITADDGTIQSSPDIKPNDKNGEILNHDAVSTVSAAFSVNGELSELKRTYQEVWTQQRGGTEKKMNGHTSEYYWNDVPVQLQEYKARLEENLCSENLFWTLSNIHWFCRGLDWKKRRDLLTEVCGLPDDRTILDAAPERFAELSEGMGDKTLSDYRAWIDAQIKKLNRAQQSYPARLDEVRKTMQKYADIDFDSLKNLRGQTEQKIRQKTNEIAQLNNGALLAGKRNELQSIRVKMQELDVKNMRHRQSQYVPVEDRRPEIKRNLNQWKSALSDAERRIAVETSVVERLDAQLTACRNDWKSVSAETFTTAVCPMCGQTLPPDAQETARHKFDADKKRRKDEILNRANELKANQEAARKRQAEAEKSAKTARKNVDEIEKELSNYSIPETPFIADLSEYESSMAAFRKQLQELETEIFNLEQQDSDSRAKLNQELARLRQDKQSLDDEIAKESVLNDSAARENELQIGAASAAQELISLEKQRSLCEDFIRFKVGYIDDNISGKFRTVRFKLFQPQVNGGLKDCCDVYVGGGRLDHGLNTGAEYNAGIDVIDVLSNHYQIRVPLFVDGAESVSDLLPIDTQIIQLIVTKTDEVLRMEVSQL